MNNITHRPKGRMCIECRFYTEFNHCEYLSFSKMRPIGKDKDGTVIVKCDAFERKQKEGDA